jgi:hypothetical protein
MKKAANLSYHSCHNKQKLPQIYMGSGRYIDWFQAVFLTDTGDCKNIGTSVGSINYRSASLGPGTYEGLKSKPAQESKN